ncbi:ttc39a [Acrasis kona]|uniref:Ttc39a n=1 Tax=Acrasis kona TaxID=1008807 RepID=A0AAW2YHM3_9EUKA
MNKMYLFQEQVQWLAWNNDIDKAINILVPHIESNLLCAVEHVQVQVIKNAIRAFSDTDVTIKETLQLIEDATKLAEKIEKSTASILELAHSTIELNKNALNNPVEGYIFSEIQNVDQEKSLILEFQDDVLIENFKLNIQVCQCELFLMKTYLQFLSGSYLKAAYNMRNAFLGYEQLATAVDVVLNEKSDYNESTLHPDLITCIRFGQGLFKYLLINLPRSVRGILSTIGYRGDRKEGLKMLRLVSQDGGRLSAFASFVLGVHYVVRGGGVKSRHHKLQKFEPILLKCLERYPSGLAFTFLASQYARKEGDLDSAIQYLERSLMWSKKKLGLTPKFVQSELSQCYFLNKAYPNVCQIIESVLSQNESDSEFLGRSISAWVLALTYSLHNRLDDRYDILDKMEDYFLTNKNKTKPIEKFVNQSLENMKKVSATDEELTLCLFVTYLELLYARDRINELTDTNFRYMLRLLLQLKDKAKRDLFNDLRIACDFFEVCFRRRIGEMSNSTAKQSLTSIISAKVQYEKQWPMYANFETAEIMYEANEDLNKVEQFVRSCYNFKCASDELFESRLGDAIEDIRRSREKKIKV